MQTIKLPPTADAITILQKHYGSPESDAYMAEEYERLVLGSQIHDLRTKAGMTQAALAKKVGVTKTEIANLENSDYEGHSLPLLRKIAAVFDMKLELKFVHSAKKDRVKSKKATTDRK